MNDVLRRHDGVRALFDNRWLHLFEMDGHGRLGHRYAGGLTWVPFDAGADGGRHAAAA